MKIDNPEVRVEVVYRLTGEEARALNVLLQLGGPALCEACKAAHGGRLLPDLRKGIMSLCESADDSQIMVARLDRAVENFHRVNAGFIEPPDPFGATLQPLAADAGMASGDIEELQK